MFGSNVLRIAARSALLCFCLATVGQPTAAYAQAGESVDELKRKSAEFVKRQAYTEALPILEKLAILEPNNAETHFYLGFALIAQANSTKDAALRKSSRIRARNAFIKCKELGSTEPVVDALIQSIPQDGADPVAFSQNGAANKLMVEAEALFSQGKLDDALRNYQKSTATRPQTIRSGAFLRRRLLSQRRFPASGNLVSKSHRD